MFIQTFKVSTSAASAGAWFSRLDLFFKKRSNIFGCKVHLCRFENGQPNRALVVRGSEVIVPAGSISTSSDGSAATPIRFTNLVYLEKEQRYGIVITPEGAYSDFELFTGEVGETDFATGERLVANPLLEGTFSAQNGNSLRESPNEDLKFTLYRAKFLDNRTGATVTLKNKPTEILVVKRDNLAMTVGVALVAGMQIVKVDNEKQPIANGPRGTVQSYESDRIRLVSLSGGGFAASDKFLVLSASGGQIGYGTVNAVENLVYRQFIPRVGVETMGVNVQTTVRTARGTASSPTVGSFEPIVPDARVILRDGSRVFASRSSEVASLASNSSIEIKMSFPQSDGYQTPVFKLAGSDVLLERQIINNATPDNEHTNNGLAGTKYVSRTVQLPEDQEAEDLRVYLTAYKPVGTTIDVYGKFLSPEDDELFDDKVWTKLNLKGNANKYSAAEDDKDLIEYEYDMPVGVAPVAGAAYLDAASEILTYVSGTTTYRTYGQFAIKIVMKADSTAKNLPALADMRAIALQI